MTAAEPGPAPGGGASALVIALAGLVSLAVAMGIGRFAFTPILPLMLRDGVVDIAAASWLASANYFGYLAGALFCTFQPWLATRFSWLPTGADAPRSIRAGLAATALLTLGMALPLPAAWPLLRFGAGVASAVTLVHTTGWCFAQLAVRGRSAIGGLVFAGPGAGIIASGVVASGIVAAVRTALGGDAPELVDATELAIVLLGDTIAANLFMLGYAWQKGWVPVAHEALMRAIELNGAAIEMNKTAFNWGRMAAHDLALVRVAAGATSIAPSGAATKQSQTPLGAPAVAMPLPLDDTKLSANLDEQIARRVAFLTDYQNAAYARQYKALVDEVRVIEQAKAPGFTTFTEAVARYAFKLMAYKDEYEVARLYTSGDFEKRIRETFDGDFKLHFNLAPPLFAKKDSKGNLRKTEYGPWVFSAFKILTKLRGLRGSAFDVFGYTAERKMERRLIVDYRKIVEELIMRLNSDNHALVVDIASIPEHIRGYAHIKERHLADALKRQHDLLDALRNPALVRAVA